MVSLRPKRHDIGILRSFPAPTARSEKTLLKRQGSTDSSVLSIGTRYITTSETRILLVKFSDPRSLRNRPSLVSTYSD